MTKIESWETAGNVHVSLEDRESPQPHHCAIAELALKYLPNQPDAGLLDVGCGLGHIDKIVREARADAEISVADAYQVCLDKTKQRVPDVKACYLLDEQEFAPQTVIDETFDVVVMAHVLEHLLEPVKGMHSAMQLVKDNGCLMLAVPNPSRPEVTISNLFRRHYVNRGHVAAWDPSHWRNFLERIMGLNVVEYRTDTVKLLPGPPGRLIAKFVGKPLAKMVPWWGFSNIAVIRKRPKSPDSEA